MIGPPREPPGSNLFMVSFGYVQNSATFELVSVSRSVGLLPQGSGELSLIGVSVLPVVAPATAFGEMSGLRHVPWSALPCQ